MLNEASSKVTPDHLRRNAYLYVRQSSLRQVHENTESAKRQYALRERALALGWAPAQITVIDRDQGQSGTSAERRAGFQELTAEVGLGRAGIVMGLEVSRLARNNADWHRLLEICALTGTLILDEDGLYDPLHFNDRFLLGMKGQMSEAEIHFFKVRMQGALFAKAREGALKKPLPVGFVYDASETIRRHPDRQVRETIELFFSTFQRTGSAYQTVRHLRENNIPFPRRPLRGPRDQELVWERLTPTKAVALLHNPHYAGAYFWGTQRKRRFADGKIVAEKLPREQWLAFFPAAHEGYISWEQFEANQRRLADNIPQPVAGGVGGAAREGSALLQGLALCGRCGERLGVSYHLRGGRPAPSYSCYRHDPEDGKVCCQSMSGDEIDEAVGKLVVESVTPLALEVSLAVADELAARADETERLLGRQIERAQYEADLARRRYMQVDPENRLVAGGLELEWNEKLGRLAAARQEYKRRRQTAGPSPEERERIMALAADFPRLWNDPATPLRERKRLLRLLLEDVTLLKAEQISIGVRFRGGATRTLTVPRPRPHWKNWVTPEAAVTEADRLLEDHPDDEVAALLNEQGFRLACGGRFQTCSVSRLRASRGLASFPERLRAKGLLTLAEMTERCKVELKTIKRWREAGLLRGVRCNARGEYMYEPPGENSPHLTKGKRLADRIRQYQECLD